MVSIGKSFGLKLYIHSNKVVLRWYLTLQGGNSILTDNITGISGVLKVCFNFKRLADTDVQCLQNGRCADRT